MNKNTLSILLLVLLTSFVNAQNMVHPGLSHKKSDLDRMKAMVEAQIEPYYSSYLNMSNFPTASYNYTVQGDVSKTEVYRDAPGTNKGIFESDSRAAYYNALRWYIEGDERYAKKAIECLNAWTGLTYVQYSGTAALTSNMVIIMLEAAEIIKSTYSGWTASEIKAFSDMLVYPGYSNTTIPSNLSTDGTWYWRSYKFDPIRAGNQELCGIRTTMAIGVFLDDTRIYDRAWRYINSMDGREDDIPFPVGPHVRIAEIDSNQYRIAYQVQELTTEPNFHGDGALVNYVYENGQCQESSRDQGHTSFGMGLLCSIGEIAWNQGDDLYAKEDSRILLGLEYTLKYNVSYVQSFSDQLNPWEPTVESGEFFERVDATGRSKSKSICPVVDNCPTCLTRGTFPAEDTWELPIAHYVGRGIKTEEDLKWTIRARDYSTEVNGRYETGPTGGAYVGFGGLSFYRPDGCYGDPIVGFIGEDLPDFSMNTLPAVIEAENFDYDPIDGEGRIYHDSDDTNTAGEYRTKQGVDIATCSEGGYQLSSLAADEWLIYTISVPSAGYYNLGIRYAAANGDGKINFTISGEDKTGEVIVPFGGDNSTGIDDWSDFTVATSVLLNAGVQSMKVKISGVSDAFVLNSLMLTEDESTIHLEAENYTEMSGVETEETNDSEGLSHVTSFDSEDWVEFEIDLLFTRNYLFDFRLASVEAGNYTIALDGEEVGAMDYTTTGGVDIWETVRSTSSLALIAGNHILRITSNTGGSQLNWINFEVDESECSTTVIEPFYNLTNPSGVSSGWGQSNTLFLLPDYILELSPSPTQGGTWGWSGPNGFSSTDRELEFTNIVDAEQGDYNVTYTNDCDVESNETISINDGELVTIEAEDYTNMSGVTTVTTTDEDGVEQVNGVDPDDWVEYDVEIPFTGTYFIDYRLASATDGELELSASGTTLSTVSYSATGGDETWTTFRPTDSVYLAKGANKLRVRAKTTGLNLNWIQLILKDLILPCNLPFTYDELAISNESLEWSSGMIDITCADSVNLFLDIVGNGSLTETDYLNIYYKLDGGSEIALSENTGEISISKLTKIYIEGSTIEIIIKSSTDSGDKSYVVSEIQLVLPPEFTRIEAEDFFNMDGIQTQLSSEGTDNVGWINVDDWIRYNDIDLTGAESIDYRIASTNATSSIEVHIDAVDGPVISKAWLDNTGGNQAWETFRRNIKETAGIHDLYMVFKGGDGYLFNFNWFELGLEREIKIQQEITFAAIPTKTIEDLSFSLDATSSSGLSIAFSSSNLEVATVDNNVITIVGIGTTVITAMSEETAEYDPAEVTQEFIVTEAMEEVLSIDFSDSMLSIYPNPTSSLFTIEMEKDRYDDLEIFDISGVKIMHLDLANDIGQFQINFEKYSRGTYILVLKGQNRIATKKIMKK